MPSLIKYFLFLLADIAIIGCILHFVLVCFGGTTRSEEIPCLFGGVTEENFWRALITLP